MISCRNLSFYYGKKNIFSNVTLDLPREGVYALIGENGVGKTTFLKLILDILKSDGIENELAHSTSFSLGENSLYENLTVYENLYYFVLLKNISANKIDDILNLCNIKKYADTKVKKLSKGTKQKVLIAKCLLLEAHLYIFDEPYNGLDPKEVINFNKILKKLKDMGKMIIISSHILASLNDLYDYVIFIKDKDIHLYDSKNISSIEDFFREDI